MTTYVETSGNKFEILRARVSIRTFRQTDRQTVSQTDSKTNRQTDRHRELTECLEKTNRKLIDNSCKIVGIIGYILK